MQQYSRNEIAEQVSFTGVRVTRFKTVRISVIAMVPLEKATVSDYALLTQVMTRSCARYPDFTALSKKLSSLYGASLEAGVRKIGESLALTFSVGGIDDRYAFGGESVSALLSELLCSVIFEPRVSECSFDSDEVEQERRQLLELCDSEFNDKRVYAGARLIELMCKDESYGLRRYGSAELIRAVTPQSLYTAWQTMLKAARFEIFYVGESSSDSAVEIFSKSFSSVVRQPSKLSTSVIARAEKCSVYNETMDVAQAKLLMGYRTDCSAQSGDVTAMRLMSVILGGSAHSRFFTNVREKLSLCYYCFCRYNRHKGILTVESGVEKENVDKARAAIAQELQAVIDGDFTEDEINSAKLTVSNEFISICDTVAGTEEWFVSQLADGRFLSVDETVAEFNAVTKERISAAASRLTLDTVYILSN